MTYWSVYSYLKQVNGQTSIGELVKRFLDVDMIAKGVKEYNDMARKNPYYEVLKI